MAVADFLLLQRRECKNIQVYSGLIYPRKDVDNKRKRYSVANNNVSTGTDITDMKDMADILQITLAYRINPEASQQVVIQ